MAGWDRQASVSELRKPEAARNARLALCGATAGIRSTDTAIGGSEDAASGRKKTTRDAAMVGRLNQMNQDG